MQYKDDFDDPGYGSSVRSAISSIFKALERKERVPERRPVWAAAVVLSLVLFLGSVLWYSYPREIEKREILAVPIIRADAGPAKVIPNDPGGMEIPHRDSTIFDSLHAGHSPDRLENLLPDAEEPVSREELFANLKTRISVEGKEIQSSSDKEEIQNITEPVSAPSKIASSTVSAPVLMPDQQISKELELAAANIPTPEVKPVSNSLSRIEPAAGVQTYETITPSGYFVQFASLRSNDAANDAWKDLQKSLPGLAGFEHRIKRVELGTRGTYYRLQAGPFAQAQAQQICAEVEAQRPGGCIVVKD